MPRFQFSLRSLVLASITLPAVLSTCLNRAPFVKIGEVSDSSRRVHPHVSRLPLIAFAKDQRLITAARDRIIVWKWRTENNGVYKEESSYPIGPSRLYFLDDFAERSELFYADARGRCKIDFEQKTDTLCDPNALSEKEALVEWRPHHPGQYLTVGNYMSREIGQLTHYAKDGKTKKLDGTFSRLPTYSPDGTIFAGTRDHQSMKGETLSFFDAESGTEILKSKRFSDSVVNTQFTQDGSKLSVLTPYFASVCDANDGQEIFEFKITEDVFFNFTPDGRAFYTKRRGDLLFRSMAGRELLYTLHTGADIISSVSISADQKLMATADDDGIRLTVSIWKWRLPFGWIAIFHMPEFWIALVFAPLLIWSLMDDRKIGVKGNHVVEKSVV